MNKTVIKLCITESKEQNQQNQKHTLFHHQTQLIKPDRQKD